MSTNFYFKIKGKMDISISMEGKIKEDIIQKMQFNFDELTEIHIGKRSGGWYPLFQETEYYSSVKEIRSFYENNRQHLDIIDEYGNKYSIEQMETELFNWNKDNPNARSHSDVHFRYRLDSEGYEFTRNEFS